MNQKKVHSCPELVSYVEHIGFLPLLPIGVVGWSADEIVDEDCHYVRLPDGGWEWPLWKWKGSVLQESGCAYGKFFKCKAGFISKEWWPDFCNYRRSLYAKPEEDSIEGTILNTLRLHGSMITRELRAACGFTGTKMRSKFDSYITRLEMSCLVVTEDFIYPHDRHGREYGWGWSLLTTPEKLFGKAVCEIDRSPEDSLKHMKKQFKKILPWSSDEFFDWILK